MVMMLVVEEKVKPDIATELMVTDITLGDDKVKSFGKVMVMFALEAT